MDYSFRLAQVCINPTTAPAPYTGKTSFLVVGNGTPSPAQEIPVGPMNSFYFPPYIRQLFLLFNEYKTVSMRLRYSPRISTTVSNNFVWAYAQDVEWPETHGLTSGGIAVPTETALTSLTNACTVVAYAPCDLSATIMDNKMKYVGNNLLNGQINYAGSNSAEDRQSMSGLFMIASDTIGISTALSVLGDVYCDLSLELCDFSTPITTSITIMRDREPLENLWGRERKSRSPNPH